MGVIILATSGIWMCQHHWNEEQLTLSAKETIAEARKSDEATNVPYDVFVNVSTPIIELTGAIQNDATIPAEHKNYAVAKELEARIKSLTSAIFTDEAQLKVQADAIKVKKAERMALIANAQNVVATLKSELRSQFGNLNVSMPASTRTPKPTKTPVQRIKSNKSNQPSKPAKKSFTRADMADLSEVADKYDVSAFTLQSICQSQNVSFTEGAILLREMMGKPPLASN